MESGENKANNNNNKKTQRAYNTSLRKGSLVSYGSPVIHN